MSLAWMAFVAALIAPEKIVPWGRAATYGTAALLLALGRVLLAAPGAHPRARSRRALDDGRRGHGRGHG